jgi:hypothetical protein
MPKMLGAPFDPGEEVVIFAYFPRTSLYKQKAKVYEYIEDEDGYLLKPLEEPISTMTEGNGYQVGRFIRVRARAVKSETFVKNTVKRYGKRIIADIFENIGKKPKWTK